MSPSIDDQSEAGFMPDFSIAAKKLKPQASVLVSGEFDSGAWLAVCLIIRRPQAPN